MLPVILFGAVAVAVAAPAAATPADPDDEEVRAPTTEIVVTGQRLDAARAKVEPSLGASTYTLTNDTI